jgi:hypothetical protein
MLDGSDMRCLKQALQPGRKELQPRNKGQTAPLEVQLTRHHGCILYVEGFAASRSCHELCFSRGLCGW